MKVWLCVANNFTYSVPFYWNWICIFLKKRKDIRYYTARKTDEKITLDTCLKKDGEMRLFVKTYSQCLIDH